MLLFVIYETFFRQDAVPLRPRTQNRWRLFFQDSSKCEFIMFNIVLTLFTLLRKSKIMLSKNNCFAIYIRDNLTFIILVFRIRDLHLPADKGQMIGIFHLLFHFFMRVILQKLTSKIEFTLLTFGVFTSHFICKYICIS